MREEEEGERGERDERERLREEEEGERGEREVERGGGGIEGCYQILRGVDGIHYILSLILIFSSDVYFHVPCIAVHWNTMSHYLHVPCPMSASCIYSEYSNVYGTDTSP